jgi:hypothetical protein
MDIPIFKNLVSKIPIDVETPNGTIHFLPMRVKRGAGSKKWRISIEGILGQSIVPNVQCYVYFKGAQFGATFSRCQESKEVWNATLETIINSPEFWDDAQ